jgi:hypothetical protein
VQVCPEDFHVWKGMAETIYVWLPWLAAGWKQTIYVCLDPLKVGVIIPDRLDTRILRAARASDVSNISNETAGNVLCAALTHRGCLLGGGDAVDLSFPALYAQH